MMKRLFSIIMVALMFTFALSVSAASVDTITATASVDEVVAGDTFDVVVNYTAANGLGGLELKVAYDTDVLKLTSIGKAGAVCATTTTPVATANSQGYVTFAYAATILDDVTDPDMTTSGKLGTLTFEVVEGATKGESEIEATATGFYYVANPDYDAEDPATGTPFNTVNYDYATLVVTGDTVTVPLDKIEGITLADGSFVYDGQPKSLAIAGTLPAGVEVTYDVENVVDAGEYTVNATFEDTNSPAIYDAAALNLSATLTITPAELTITSVDVDNSTVEFDGRVENDDVDIDYGTLVIEKVEIYDEDELDEEYWEVSGFELVGDDAGNYTLVTEVVAVDVDDIDDANVVTVTVYSEFEDVDEVYVSEYEFYIGQTSVIYADLGGKDFKFVAWSIDGEEVEDDDEDNAADEFVFVAEEDFEIWATYEKSSNLAAITAALIGSKSRVKVYFDTIAGSQVHTQTIKKGECATRPANPTKGNLKFAGWYADKEYTVPFDFDAPVEKDITLYAKWDTPDNRIIMTIDKVEAMVFGEKVANDVPPIIVNDRTMLPARFVAEALGATVSWDIVTRKATIVGNGVTIVLTIGETTAYINGNPVTIDSPAFIRNDRTYTPVRFIAEALGAKVEWNAVERQAIITK